MSKPATGGSTAQSTSETVGGSRKTRTGIEVTNAQHTPTRPPGGTTIMPPALRHLRRGDSMASLDRLSTSTGYEFQPHQLRRQKRQKRVITGKISQTHGTFKGAPEPQRDIFVYRVDQDANIDDMSDYLTDKNVKISKLECVSNANAKFKSFRLTVGLTDFKRLLNDDMWPAGVRARKFITPRENNRYQEDNNDGAEQY